MNTVFLANLTNPNTNILAIAPEIMLAITGTLVMLYDSLMPKQRYVTGAVSLIGIVFAAILLGMSWNDPVYSSAWNGMVINDGLRISFSFVFLFVTAMTILISSVWIDREDVPVGEYHSLLMFATVGMMFMASGNDLVIIFLGLETLSIATYVMAGLRKSDLRSNESAMKYFILGSFATGFLLYGMALIYGATGSTNISEIAVKIANPNFPALLLIGAAMLVIGFGFKIASVPFHIWTPDVYEGAPTPVTAFFATAPKVAAMALIARLVQDAFGGVSSQWGQVLAVLSVASMFLGAIAAIGQTDIKRLMAYSSIAHMGFALMGLAAGGAGGVQAMLIYMAIYVTMNVGTFAFILSMEKDGRPVTDIGSLNQFSRREPLKALAMLVLLFSLAGVPPMLGFFGKFYVLKAAVDADMAWLALAGAVASVIGAFYYLRIVYFMYFGAEVDGADSRMVPAQWLAFVAVSVIMLAGIINLFGIGTVAAAAAQSLVG